MGTRYGREQLSQGWDYPTDLAAFLSTLGTSSDDPREARARVSLFVLTAVARRMPRELRLALTEAQLLDGPIPTRLDGDRR